MRMTRRIFSLSFVGRDANFAKRSDRVGVAERSEDENLMPSPHPARSFHSRASLPIEGREFGLNNETPIEPE